PVHLSDSRNDPSIERLELWVQRCGIEIRSDRLVKKIISDHRRLVSVTRSNLSPQVDCQLLTLTTFEKKRIGETVVDIVTGLSAGRSVHVQNHIQTFAATPADEPV